MEPTDENKDRKDGLENKQDCGCGENCCPPEKNNRFTKIIFVAILLSAVGIIAVKLFNRPAPAAANAACCEQGVSPACDSTTATAGCDTTKGSSCCPKN